MKKRKFTTALAWLGGFILWTILVQISVFPLKSVPCKSGMNTDKTTFTHGAS